MLNRSKRKAVMFAAVSVLLAMALIVTAGAELAAKTSANNSDTNSKRDSYINSIEIGSSRYEKPYKNTAVENMLTLDGFKKLLANDALEIWYRPETAGIRILDRRSGYIWGGLKEDDPENMNTRWAAIGNSLLTIDYYNKEGMEHSAGIDTSKHEAKYSVNGDTANFEVNFKDLSITLKFALKLKEHSIEFALDSSYIKEEKDFKVGRLSFIPFLGAVEPADNIEGYVFLPDGPGSLMRFGRSSSYLAAFEKRVYGKDYGIDLLYETNDLKSNRPNDFATSEETVHMPVFGMVHGIEQNAWFARITDGEEYASINAVPSGMQTDYTWASAKFIFRQKYSQPMTRSGAGVQIVQKQPNAYSLSIEYFFLTGEDADYSGMASLYRNQLIEEGSLPVKGSSADGSIPLKLDFIVSDIEKSFLFNHNLVVTGAGKIEEAVDYFNSLGITNTDVVLLGWQRGGLNGSKKSDLSLRNSLGSKDFLASFIKRLSDKAGRVSLYDDPVTSKSLQLNIRQDASISVSQSVVKVIRENPLIWLNETYFIKPQVSAERVNKLSGLMEDNDIPNLALSGYGHYLYAEHLKGNVLTREAALALVEETLAKAKERTGLGFYNANEYAWKYADALYDIPMVSSQLLFETDTVPFMQMVLAGSVDYFAPYTNISFFSRTDMLKHIDYGTYPSFLITELGNYELRQTPISEYSSTRYEDWVSTAADYYKEINSILSQVHGRKMTERTVIGEGVVKVDYEGGRSVIVNYTNSSVEAEGMTIAPKSAAVTGVVH